MSGIKPPNFDTLFLTLGEDPVDLTENQTLLPWPPDVPTYTGDASIVTYASREVFVQCIAGSARWRESDAAPASGAPGHILGLGDGVFATLTRRARSARGFWVWRAAAGTTVAILPAAAAPTRDATLDAEVEPTAA